jgi:hypothetical protein
MARTVMDAKLESRTARLKLSSRKKPYFRSIDPGRHLGYYKGSKGGIWLARINDGGAYREQKLGTADDVRDANDLDVLSFSQAQSAARNWFDSYALEKVRVPPELTTSIREAVQTYIGFRNEREALRQGRNEANSSAAYKLALHVLEQPSFCSLTLKTLTVDVLRSWRASLPGTAATRQRVTNDLKAALNAATKDAEVKQAIKDGLSSTTAYSLSAVEGDASVLESKILTDQQVRSLLEAVRARGDEDI